MEKIYWSDLEYDCKKIYGDFVIFGTSKRWNGEISGLNIMKDCTLMDVIYKEGKDCGYFKIANLTNGGIYLKCTHHDGTNEVEIHMLNSAGKDIVSDLDFAESKEEERICIESLKAESAWKKISL